jgi:hypothetical protein
MMMCEGRLKEKREGVTCKGRGWKRGLLHPDDGTFDQRLSKDLALLGPFHSFFDRIPHRGNKSSKDEPPLMIKIVHDERKAPIFFADQIFRRHLGIFKRDVCSSGAGGVRSFDRLRVHSLLQQREEDTHCETTNTDTQHVFTKGKVRPCEG